MTDNLWTFACYLIFQYFQRTKSNTAPILLVSAPAFANGSAKVLRFFTPATVFEKLFQKSFSELSPWIQLPETPVFPTF